MSHVPRRVPPPNQQYYAVPQSPSGPSRAGYQPPQPPVMIQQGAPSSQYSGGIRNETAHGVATGAIGGGYGPYSYNPNTVSSANGRYTSSRISAAMSDISVGTTGERSTGPQAAVTGTSTVQSYPYMWDPRDPDLDDPLHNPDPVRDAALDRSCTPWSSRGWMNASMLGVIVGGLITLFAGYPIINFYTTKQPKVPGFNLGGINGSGQIPNLPNMPSLIDAETPSSAMQRTGTDGKTYNLVFSDEFETEGRTFWPGDDPFWEAVNLNYWPTGDIEWYDPQAITTEGGKLVITMEEIENHNLNFRSGMLQSWNKFCFTTGYIEVSVSLPGSPRAPGLWPAVWTMGNLGRAGYGATTEGMWPYSYDSCDVGTFPNQTDHNGQPSVDATGGSGGGQLSGLPGQKTSACTCPGSDHPGPSVNVGRGVPEIDVFEAQIEVEDDFQPEVSQSFQVAPYDLGYNIDRNFTTQYNESISHWNPYQGGPLQEAISTVTFINDSLYDDQAYGTYGFEWWSDPSNRGDGYVTWFSNPTGGTSTKTWTLEAGAIGPNSQTEVAQRLIPEEPHYIIMNLGMSPSFQHQDFMHLQFPVKMYIDYVRVYQRSDVKNGVTCDPPSYPTADYIKNHMNAYTNPNLTTWDAAGYTFPRNSMYDGC